MSSDKLRAQISAVLNNLVTEAEKDITAHFNEKAADKDKAIHHARCQLEKLRAKNNKMPIPELEEAYLALKSIDRKRTVTELFSDDTIIKAANNMINNPKPYKPYIPRSGIQVEDLVDLLDDAVRALEILLINDGMMPKETRRKSAAETVFKIRDTLTEWKDK